MSDLDSLIKSIPIDQVASALGVDQATATQAVATAVPTILAGLHHNAQSPEGAGALANALAGKDTSILNGLSLDQIDVTDGAKILSHIFGGGTDHVASGVAAQLSGSDVLGQVLGQVLGGGAQSAPAPTPAPAPADSATSGLVQKLLPLLAPIVLAWLAQQATQKGGQVSSGSGGLIQDVLGGLLKGAGQQADNKSTTSVVTDILGSILRGR